MEFFRRHKLLLVILVIAVLILAMSVASLFTSGRMSPLSDLLGTFFKPFETMLSGVMNHLGSFYGYIYEYDSMSARLEELNIRIASLEAELREMDQMKEENRLLKELAGVKESRPDFRFESAKIIARDISNWSRAFTLDKGSQNSVSVGDCVLSAEGYLVGAVSEISKNWCTVVTLIDTDMDAGAKIFRTGQTAVAEGRFDLMLKDRLALLYLPPASDLLIGDLVLTSGTGGAFPGDIPIGTVAAVREEPDGMSVSAEIVPAVDLDALRVCYIVTDFRLPSAQPPPSPVPAEP